jgi:hypothetical protein
MASLFIAALLIVLGFSRGAAWAHVSTDTPSFTEWHWRSDVVIVATLFSAAYVAGCAAEGFDHTLRGDSRLAGRNSITVAALLQSGTSRLLDRLNERRGKLAPQS